MTSRSSSPILVAMLSWAVGLGACTNGEGTLAVRIYGEPFIEEGIPADVFVDGWSVEFARFLIAVDGIEADGVADGRRYAFDLVPASDGDGHEVTTLEVPIGAQQLAYRVAPGAAADGGNASASETALLADMGYSIFVEGTATKDLAHITFAWGFDSTTEYRDCEVVDEVLEGGDATTVLTIHADHLFYDDLESPEPNVAFDLIATSDEDLDDDITADELRFRDITTEERYQVGSAPITDLWAFISAQTRTLGHIDGEGHCAS